MFRMLFGGVWGGVVVLAPHFDVTLGYFDVKNVYEVGKNG